LLLPDDGLLLPEPPGEDDGWPAPDGDPAAPPDVAGGVRPLAPPDDWMLVLLHAASARASTAAEATPPAL
jgi:hypothetical protein